MELYREKCMIVHVNDVVTDWSYMLSPDFLFSRFLVFPPANSSNFHIAIVFLVGYTLDIRLTSVFYGSWSTWGEDKYTLAISFPKYNGEQRA